MKYSKLRTLRKQHHYTCKQMSEMLGISKVFYSQLEMGTRNLYYNMAIKIAAIFNLKPDKLFYDDCIKYKKESD